MVDVITLSSDDEQQDFAPPKKRVKLVHLEKIVVSSDDDEKAAEEEVAAAPRVSHSQPLEQTIPELLENFLETCHSNISQPELRNGMKDKSQFMRDALDKYLLLAEDREGFRKTLEEQMEKVLVNPNRSCVHFVDVYTMIKLKMREESHIIEPNVKRKVKRLEQVLSKIKKRIDKLEQAECNFDDEEDSTYIQLSKYKERATQIHTKICKYRKVNPYYGRLTYQRLNFNQSNHAEINDAINTKYKDNREFPTYKDMENLVSRCVKERGLALDSADVSLEAKRCFEILGNQIQKQRRRELGMIHADYLLDMPDDPAKDNPVIQGKLLESYKIKMEDESKIFEKFTRMQEKGIKCSDSEDASVADSDSDNENDGNGVNETTTIISD